MIHPPRRVAIIGGSGFVGRQLGERLARAGLEQRIVTRAREHARASWLLPGASIVTCDPCSSEALAAACAGCDAVVNLVGILNERGDSGAGFRRAHVDVTRSALEACARAGVSHYLHMSALNAAAAAPSHYLRSKGEAERLVRGAPTATTIFRPSVIFGPGDGLLCRFDALLALSPVLPLACAAARFQPVYVGDVAEALVRCLGQAQSFGETYELGGPAVMTLAEIVDAVRRATGRRRLVLPLGAFASRLEAEIFEHLPGKPFSRDNFRSASVDSVLTGPDGLARLGITPVALDAVLARCLGRGGERPRYDALRRHAGR
jgi:NADH dehydrogenase